MGINHKPNFVIYSFFLAILKKIKINYSNKKQEQYSDETLWLDLKSPGELWRALSLSWHFLNYLLICIVTCYLGDLVKSFRTLSIRSLLQNTSIAVMAIALLAIKVFSCASSVIAAVVNAWEWLGAVVPMEYMGCIDGTTWETFPMSVEAEKDAPGWNVTPRVSAFAW